MRYLLLLMLALFLLLPATAFAQSVDTSSESYEAGYALGQALALPITLCCCCALPLLVVGGGAFYWLQRQNNLQKGAMLS